MLNWIKEQYTDLKPFIVGGILIMTHAFFMISGADIATRNADRERDEAIKNAIANAPDSSLTCKEHDLLDAIVNLSENGAHLNGYELRIQLDNRDEKN